MEHSSKKTNRKVHKTSMANFKETTDENGFKSVVAFIDGNILGADQNNKHYDEIISRLWSDDLDGVVERFSPEHAVAVAFAQLSADVKIEDGIVYFRGEAVNKNLGTHLIRLWEAGESYKPVVKFLERLYNNPQPESREMLWDFISSRHLTLCDNGLVLAYKGVNEDFSSSRTGEGDIVDGSPVDKIYNKQGVTVEKARELVEFDPNQTCSRGLHVATWDFARSFGQKVVEVIFDPKDVVSVTSDANGEKVRVCKYKVIKEVTKPREDFVVEVDRVDSGSNNPTLSESKVFEITLDSNRFGVVTPNDVRKTLGIKIDTTKNHLSQKRDKSGRFIKKGD